MLQVISNFLLWLISRLSLIWIAPMTTLLQGSFNVAFVDLFGYISAYIITIKEYYHLILSALGISNFAFNMITGVFFSYILAISGTRIVRFALNIYNKLKP